MSEMLALAREVTTRSGTKGSGPHEMKMGWWFCRLNRIEVRC